MLWVNYVSIIGLILSYASRYINPIYFWYFSFFGLAYPILLLINVFFIFYWMIQMRKQLLFSFIAIIAGWNSLFSNFAWHLSVKENNFPKVKIMTYNSMLFDLYNWSKNKKSRSEIFEMLKENSPDILCLQEFYHSDEPGNFNNADTLIQFLPSKNIHTVYTVTERNTDHWGLATLSRFPIVNKGQILFETSFNNACLFTDLIIDKDTVRVYNIHLASVNLDYSDYKFIKHVKDSLITDSDKDIESSKNIFRHLQKAFIKRANQTAIVAKHISTCPYPVIVCGDFNDTPNSYTYQKIKGKLNDSFLEVGWGIGESYSGLLPFLRIDYVLYADYFQAIEYRKVKETITDHYPLIVYLQKK